MFACEVSWFGLLCISHHLAMLPLGFLLRVLLVQREVMGALILATLFCVLPYVLFPAVGLVLLSIIPIVVFGCRGHIGAPWVACAMC